MKKVALSIIVAGMFAFVACGPKGPTPEQLKADSITKDSIAKDSIAKDSIAIAVVADSIAKAVIADSIAKAAVAPVKKGGKK